MSYTKPVEQTVDFNEIVSSGYEQFIINACTSSTRFGHITLQERTTTFKTRGHINCILIKPFGTGKTTIVYDIEGPEVEDANTITMPGIIGSITKQGQFLEGSAYRARGKLLRLDEAQSLTQDVKEAMCSILEYPHKYKRALGYKMYMPVREGDMPEDNKLTFGWIRGSENNFQIMSRFSCIASTILLNRKTPIDKAFASRFIPIKIIVSTDDIWGMLSGEKKYNVKPIEFEESFYFPKYMKFLEYAKVHFDNSRWKALFRQKPEEVGYISRIFIDIVRLGAYLGAIQGNTEVQLDDCMHVLEKYGDIIYFNTMIGGLDDTDYNILRLSRGRTQQQLADIIGIDQSTIKRKIDSLLARGVLRRI